MNNLKTLSFMLLLTLAAPSLFAQTQRDSSTAPERWRGRNAPKFVDENGDGIDDRFAGRGQGLQRGKDKFIDRDGDGICDSRASGLGFRHGASDLGGGTKGKGKRQGQGGKP